MAPTSDLPCDGDGVCMLCKTPPSLPETLTCVLCATPWHVPCLSNPPPTMASAAAWECPDCSLTPESSPMVAPLGGSGGLVAKVRAIEMDPGLTEVEKARRRQELVSGGRKVEEERDPEVERKREDVLRLIEEKFSCDFCMQLPERPVTTPCGHNFCLKCFQKWTGQGRNTCAKCRAPIPPKMASHPRFNSTLVELIRTAKTAKIAASNRLDQVYYFIRNENRPDKAYTTDRAKKAGKANACSGQIFVTIPSDHFGPITAEYDPKRNQGVLVGETWEDRMECRQWGVHFPHVAGIAGQSDCGAQSVVLSGGYEDDEDHGDWFLYTGSGGRDLSGNKRTNNEQASDQEFDKYNKALKVSCKKGYPVRVVRSHKEKRSSYAPDTGVRYDGVYRIEKCWRKAGKQGYKMCRYLFIRCDNEPAPWTSDEHGDCPRPLPVIKELKNATDITERKESPFWDYEEKTGWKWVKPPPLSKKPAAKQEPKDGVKVRKVIRCDHNTNMRGRLLKGGIDIVTCSCSMNCRKLSCLLCRNVMKFPLTTPCAHNFCKSCLLESFSDLSFIKERTREGGRTLRAQKIVNKCPCCPTDISDFLKNPQVNRDMMNLIETLQVEIDKEGAKKTSNETSGVIETLSQNVLDSEKKRIAETNVAVGKTNEGICNEMNNRKSDAEDCGTNSSNVEGLDIDEKLMENKRRVVKKDDKICKGNITNKKSGPADVKEAESADGATEIHSTNSKPRVEEQIPNNRPTTPKNSRKRKKPDAAVDSRVKTRSMDSKLTVSSSGVRTRSMELKFTAPGPE